MLYLSPSCGAAGVFLGGAGLGVSISSPTYRKSIEYFIQNFKIQNSGPSRSAYLWSESLCGWGHEL